MPAVRKISPCLWFDNQAEDAAEFYVSVFANNATAGAKTGTRIVQVSRYTEAGHETHQRPAGSVMTVAFELDGQPFTALNGGPVFTFSEAVSLEVHCADQAEIDYFWETLSKGGDPKAQQCGWLKDKYGLSWQIVPEAMLHMFEDHESPQAARVMEAMLGMKKVDIAALQRAFAG